MAIMNNYIDDYQVPYSSSVIEYKKDFKGYDSLDDINLLDYISPTSLRRKDIMYDLLKKKSKLNKGFMNKEEKYFWNTYKSEFPLSKNKQNYFEISKSGCGKYFEKLHIIDRLYLTSMYQGLVESLFDVSNENTLSNEYVSMLADQYEYLSLNPFFRKAISIKSNDALSQESKIKSAYYKKLDEEFNTRNFLNTFRPISPKDKRKMKEYFVSGQNENHLKNICKSLKATNVLDGTRYSPKTFEKAYSNYFCQSIIVMQLLFMAQIGKTGYIEADNVFKEWDCNVSSIFCHGSRVIFIFPYSKNKNVYHSIKNMFKINEEYSPVYHREAATHFIKGESLIIEGESKTIKEKGGIKAAIKSALDTNYKHYGMDLAIGGIMNLGVDEMPILNDGTNGHFYIGMRKQNSKDRYALLIGLESESPGLINKYGHIHDARALSSEISATGGFKVDLIGKKLGGRVIDLSNFDPNYLCNIIEKFEKLYERLWNENDSYKDNSRINRIIDVLGGKKIRVEEAQSLISTFK